MGALFALAGGAVWPAHALGLIPYPGPLHMALMMQGFEQCFVLGFLLTAMPAFTHSTRCQPWELGWATLSMVVFGALAFAGLVAAAHAAYLASLVLLGVAGARRVVRNPRRPPEEFLFVGLGLLLGVLGATLLLAAALDAGPGLPPRFAERLLSLGLLLSLVIGVGSLLVPTFAGMRDPLVIPGLAAPHERRGRRRLYSVVIAALLLAFGTEWRGHAQLGMLLRAAAVTVMGLWVWKLTRLPRRDAPGFALWGSGWLVMTGLWTNALGPRIAVAGLHIVFIGGFAMLTLGIGTRVLVSHGRHPLAKERQVFDPWVLVLLLGALLLRVRAGFAAELAGPTIAWSALLWMLAWALWTARVMPLILRPHQMEPVIDAPLVGPSRRVAP